MPYCIQQGLKIIGLIGCICHAALSHCAGSQTSNPATLWHQIGHDYREFYTLPNLQAQAFMLGVDAVMANTDFDPIIQRNWQHALRSQGSDDFFKAVNQAADFTQYVTAIPVYALLMFVPNEPIALWANHCLRSLLLGAPPQAILSSALGSGRPPTGQHQWHPFRYHRAVSGHAFYGALPLLNLAQQTDDPLLKAVCYTASVLPGLARIHHNSHYTSQVFLGWWLAYSATQTVWQEKIALQKDPPIYWGFQPLTDGISLEVHKKF